MLKDNDHRIRNNAATAICEYVKRCSMNIKPTNHRKYNGKEELLITYVSDHVFKQLPSPLNQLKITPDAAVNHSVLGEVLYSLTNMLLELENREQQVNFVDTSFQFL